MRALVTGGAGFIGSHLVDALLRDGHQVRVLDDLSTGLRTNVGPDVELIESGITDAASVETAMTGVELVFHEAALGSVRRSVEQPLMTDHVNVHGTLTVLEAARHAGVRRVVAASSSSVYGGTAPLPTSEQQAVNPRSPYAVTKVTVEHYCRVYAEQFGLETVCLRYFNVYGPRQRVDSEYAAVIPLFIDALRNGVAVTIHGDGEQCRDFTFVGDAVAANLLAASAPADRCSGRRYNVGTGQTTTLLGLLEVLAKILGVEARVRHIEPRAGDVRRSRADVTAALDDLGYEPRVTLEEGLRRLVGSLGYQSTATTADA